MRSSAICHGCLLLAAAATVPMDVHAAPSSAAPAGDVLGRCKSLHDAESKKGRNSPNAIALGNDAIPAEIQELLTKQNLQWKGLSDTVRIGLLWSYGYVLYGNVDDAKYSQIAKVYTGCSAASKDEQNGVSMDDIELSSAKFTSVGCTVSKCGSGMDQATNDRCSMELKNQLTCAIETPTVDFPTSRGSIWVSIGSSNSMPYPQVFAHSISVAKTNVTDSSSLALYSIHMESGVGSTSCQSSGDLVIPCLRLQDAEKQSFCRPSVKVDQVKTFLSTVESSGTANRESEVGSGTTIIVIVVLCVVLLAAGLGFVWWRKRKQFGQHGGRNDQRDGGLRSGGSYLSSKLSSDQAHALSQNDNNSRTAVDSSQYPSMTSSQFTNSFLTNSSMTESIRGKTINQFCDESEYLRDFLSDPVIFTKTIPYDEITFLRLLSKGAFGEVWLGQLETRHVAIKKLLPEKCHITKCLEQFAGEIRLMCALQHANIVSLVGVSWNNQLQNLCAVAEYMESGDLNEVMQKQKDKLTWPKEKISIAMDISEGLVYLHSLRPIVIHRDLKSKNILLNKKYHAKLSDFGVSRKRNVNETMTSGVGTLLWTAPEIIEGKKYSEKADIYSLGVVLSEIDTCEGPFAQMKTDKGDKIPGMQLVQMVRLGKLRVSFRDDCPSAIRALAEACTNLDPDLRPSSMEVAFTLKSKIAPLLRQTKDDPTATSAAA